MGIVVAIDGPAGSGKGKIKKEISKRTGLINLDSGAMYRCVALAALRKGLNEKNKDAIIKLVDTLDIEIKLEDNNNIVYLNGENVTSIIRESEVTNLVSPISTIIPVRLKLIELQRKMADGKDIIMEGRDIGTYVFPRADLKIYLDADQEERAKRRYKENIEKGIECTYEEILENVKDRDYRDSHREMGALKQADDAIVVDSTNMSIEEVTNRIIELMKEKNLI